MKKISVIIPCHNSYAYLHQCVGSILDQTMPLEDLEVILIDDASTDQTWDIISEYAAQYPGSILGIRLFTNLRQGGARNRGIERATGKYLIFLDSDDWILPETYKTLYEIAEKEELDVLQYNHFNYFDGIVQLVDLCTTGNIFSLEDENSRRRFLLGKPLGYRCAEKLYRRSVVEGSRARFVEHRIFEEPSFVLPVYFYAKRIRCIKECFSYIRQHSESTMKKDVKEDGRIRDHGEAQLHWLKNLGKDREIFERYFFEIEYLFLLSYLIETIYFSGANKMKLEAEYFSLIQKNIKMLFPEWKSNPYIANMDDKMKDAFATIDQELTTEELELYCRSFCQAYK